MSGSILVVGAGKMGSALVEGWLGRGVDPGSITLLDPALAAAASPWVERGVHVTADAGALSAATPDLVLLAVKPQMMEAVLPSLSGLDRPGLVVVSIAAGTRVQTLRATFRQAMVVRTMPNTPAAVGAGVTACFGPDIDVSARNWVDSLLGAVGVVVWVDSEADMDAVTALSGSGPAYVFHMVEALAEAGEALGLAPETAMVLARQTVVGAGALLQASDASAATLRANVTSPGGTTAAGLAVLRDTGALAGLMRETLEAARDRSVALSAPEA